MTVLYTVVSRAGRATEIFGPKQTERLSNITKRGFKLIFKHDNGKLSLHDYLQKRSQGSFNLVNLSLLTFTFAIVSQFGTVVATRKRGTCLSAMSSRASMQNTMFKTLATKIHFHCIISNSCHQLCDLKPV